MSEDHESNEAGLLSRIFGRQQNTRKTIESLKKEIICDGDLCKPVNIIPQPFYNSYLDLLKANFPDNHELRVRKQRQFNSLCNQLFESRNDFMVSHSNATNDKDSCFYQRDDGVFVLKLGITTEVIANQRNAFFLLRNYANTLPTHSTMKFLVDMQEWTLAQALNFYFLSTEKVHVCTFLIMESMEFEIKVTVKCHTFFQKFFAKLFLRALSENSKIISLI